MATENKKIIAVVGATGNQGSSVAKTFLSLPNWRVRCLTRRASSPKAQALAEQGAEVVEADLNDVTSLAKAFEGAAAIFVNTDFWQQYEAGLESKQDPDLSAKVGYETEVAHGKNAAAAAAGTRSLERFVYSALGPMARASGGKYWHSNHWESKAAIVDHIRNELPGLAAKTSFIYVGAYDTNPLLLPRKDPNGGAYVHTLPCAPETTVMPVINPKKRTGPFVRALVEDEAAGTTLLAYEAKPSIAEAVDTWSRVTGKKATAVGVSIEKMHEISGLPYEVLDGPAFIGEFGYMAGIPGFIEPHQLKQRVEVDSYESLLRARGMNELLGTS
jgi:hypothetical protein